MNGFFEFEKEKLQLPYRSEKGIHSCTSCGLYATAISPKMKPYGEFKKEIMVIGEAPGAEEDEKGMPWQGKMGQALNRKYKRLGIDIFEDCVSLNAVNCRPVDKKGNNRAPNDREIVCCRQRVLNVVKQYRPKVIILHGGAAVSSLIGYKWKRDLGGIMKWRGWTIPDRDYQAWLCPTFHPSFVERQEEQNEVEVIWDADLKQAFSKAAEPFPEFGDEEKSIITSHDVEGTLRRFIREKEARLIAFDIETTGLKPYNKTKHRIVSISFCNDANEAHAIPFPTERKHLKLLKRLLEHPKIGKIAANMKFEDNWLNVLHGIEVRPWIFDTMQAAHILDNRPGITGLKFQAYVRFGVLGYDESVNAYLKSADTNSPNRIMNLTRNKNAFRKLLTYNGVDSLLEYRLAKIQMKELGFNGGEYLNTNRGSEMP